MYLCVCVCLYGLNKRNWLKCLTFFLDSHSLFSLRPLKCLPFIYLFIFFSNNNNKVSAWKIKEEWGESYWNLNKHFPKAKSGYEYFLFLFFFHVFDGEGEERKNNIPLLNGSTIRQIFFFRFFFLFNFCSFVYLPLVWIHMVTWARTWYPRVTVRSYIYCIYIYSLLNNFFFFIWIFFCFFFSFLLSLADGVVGVQILSIKTREEIKKKYLLHLLTVLLLEKEKQITIVRLTHEYLMLMFVTEWQKNQHQICLI